ncbi:MAG: ankyrin repeat domain-containing protein [Bryobacterales bacterium]|nr:ankyrin repeat domain-containing protein [Bryobacterales bacterium]
MPEKETRSPRPGARPCKTVLSSRWMGSESLIESIRARKLADLRAAVSARPDEAGQPRAILEAARVGWKDGIKLLLAAGADPNASWRNYRPLHALIQEDPHREGSAPTRTRVHCLSFLLAQGADPEQMGAWPSARALVIAAFQGEPLYVAELRKSGARHDGFTAAALGDEEGVRTAVRSDAAFPSQRDGGLLTALQCCAGSRMGKNDPPTASRLTAIAKLLLDRGADVNAQTRSWDHDVDAIYFASASGQRDIFILLLERGANADTALISALWRGNMEFASIALRKGADVDRAQDGDRPILNQLVRWGQLKPAMWLLDRGASPNMPDARGWTALHQAASRGNERILQALLKAGGDPSIKDAEGRRPIEIARATKKTKIVQLLH